MSDLEPITRAENFWVNEGDLEPITRKEQYIKHLYDETQVVPEYPKTREEYFINKAGEELHDVTIEQLNVSSNGTYSESGKAYNPVIVDVPLPENAYLLKDIPNTPTAIATFTDGSPLPMPKLEVAIEPVQEGSGDPSPENIRPISGWSAVDVTVADDVDNPTTTETITIQLGDTYYGGKLGVVSGVLTVTYAKIALADIPKSKYGNYQYGIRAISSFFDSIPNSSLLTGMSNTFVLTDSGESYNVDKCSIVFSGGSSKTSFLISTQASGLSADASIAEINEWLRSIEAYIVYPLATPTTIQLTPTAVKSLLGTNNLFADCGNVLEASYFSKEV